MPANATSLPQKLGAPRTLRQDAQRNRERILQVARETFAQRGAEASMDEVARGAQVGAGTLYRHFPTREALITAVFAQEVAKLITDGERFAATLPPLAALRAWMLQFIEYVAAKLLILPAMDTLPGGSAVLIQGTRGQIHGMFHRLIQAAVAGGELRADTNADDIMRAFMGVFQTIAMPGWEPSARRIVDLLLAGAGAS